MEEARDGVIVCDVSARALIVPQSECSPANLTPAIAAQGTQVEGMDETGYSGVAVLEKLCAAVLSYR
jgi:hypothetical protein